MSNEKPTPPPGRIVCEMHGELLLDGFDCPKCTRLSSLLFLGAVLISSGLCFIAIITHGIP